MFRRRWRSTRQCPQSAGLTYCYGGNNTSIHILVDLYMYLVRTAVDPIFYNESSEDSSELMASELTSSVIGCC